MTVEDIKHTEKDIRVSLFDVTFTFETQYCHTRSNPQSLTNSSFSSPPTIFPKVVKHKLIRLLKQLYKMDTLYIKFVTLGLVTT